MCVYSMIAQDKIDDWKDRYWPTPGTYYYPIQVTKEEFEQLKKEVQDLQRLLKKALKYDEENDEPECESEDKKRILKEMAEKLGISIEFPEGR